MWPSQEAQASRAFVAADQKESLKIVEEYEGRPLQPLLLPCTFQDLQIAPSTADTPPTSTTI